MVCAGVVEADQNEKATGGKGNLKSRSPGVLPRLDLLTLCVMALDLGVSVVLNCRGDPTDIES
jgi:hypothetical protein